MRLWCNWNRRRLPLLLFTPILLTSCTKSLPVIPKWFDAIHRMPVRTVLVNGHHIAYLDIGEGPPVILIHGFGGSMWQWEYQQDVLAREHRVLTLDLLGSGISDKPAIDYTPTQLVEHFAAFMNALGLQRASLVGNSMGAGLAMGMALTHPDRVERLVLIGGFPQRVRQKLTSPLIRRLLDSRVPAWLLSFLNKFAGRIATKATLKEMVYDQTLLTPAVVERSHRNRMRPGFIPPILAVARNLPLWETGFATRIGEIRHPTLIIWGTEDRVLPADVGQELQKLIPGSQLRLIPEAGHLPQWERPDLVNPLLLQFLQP